VEHDSNRCIVQDEPIYMLDKLVPDLVNSMDHSQSVVSVFNGENLNGRVMS
jgi:hypothetical protein